MNDKSNTEGRLSADERKVSEIYRNTATELPSVDIDAAILALAKKKTNATNKKSKKTWLFPSSIAASIMVVAVVYFSINEQNYAPNGQDIAFLPPAPEASSTFQPEVLEFDTTAAAAVAESSAEQQLISDDRDAMVARMRVSEERERMLLQETAAQDRALKEKVAHEKAAQERAAQEQQAMIASAAMEREAASAQKQAVREKDDLIASDSANLDEGTENPLDLTKTADIFYQALLDIQHQLTKSHQEIMLVVGEKNAEPDVEDLILDSSHPTLAFNNLKNKDEEELFEEYKTIQIQFYQTLRLSKKQSDSFELLDEYRLLLTDEQIKELVGD